MNVLFNIKVKTLMLSKGEFSCRPLVHYIFSGNKDKLAKM